MFNYSEKSLETNRCFYFVNLIVFFFLRKLMILVFSWFVGEHGYFRYASIPGSFYSSSDWIGLFPVNDSKLTLNIYSLNPPFDLQTPHCSFDDYLTYIWSPGASSDNLGCISGRYITKPGFYRLIYFSSSLKCGIGYSEVFEIKNSC